MRPLGEMNQEPRLEILPLPLGSSGRGRALGVQGCSVWDQPYICQQTPALRMLHCPSKPRSAQPTSAPWGPAHRRERLPFSPHQDELGFFFPPLKKTSQWFLAAPAPAPVLLCIRPPCFGTPHPATPWPQSGSGTRASVIPVSMPGWQPWSPKPMGHSHATLTPKLLPNLPRAPLEGGSNLGHWGPTLGLQASGGREAQVGRRRFGRGLL